LRGEDSLRRRYCPVKLDRPRQRVLRYVVRGQKRTYRRCRSSPGGYTKDLPCISLAVGRYQRDAFSGLTTVPESMPSGTATSRRVLPAPSAQTA